MNARRVLYLFLSIAIFQFAISARGSERLLTREAWEEFGLEDKHVRIHVRPVGERHFVDMERRDARGFKSPVDTGAILQVLEFGAREHVVHYSPDEASSCEYDFFLNLDMIYEVMEPAPVFLAGDDEMCYWRVRNYETGKRGALYSGEKLDLSEKGIFKATVPVFSGFKHIEKGTGLLVRRQFYAVYCKETNRKIDYTRFHPMGGRPWKTIDYRMLENEFYPGLLFLVADLSEFSLSLKEPSYSDCGRLAVRLSITDAAGDKFYLPRADVKAEVTVQGGREVVELSPALHPHAVPKNYFEGFLPGGGAPEEASFSARVSFVNPEGGSEARFVRADFQAGEFAPYAGEDTRALEFGVRGLSQHTGWVSTREGIDRTIEDMRRANLILLRGQYFRDRGALWRSEIVPRIYPDMDFDEFDPVAYAIEKAHENDMILHAKIDCFQIPPGEAGKFRERTNARGEAQANRACPRDEDYRDYLAMAAGELCANYDIDGIELDLIRTHTGCFCEVCIKDYREEHGYSLIDDYREYYPYPERLARWKESGPGGLVAKIRDTVDGINPDIRMGIFGYTIASPSDRDMNIQGQIPTVWLEDGKIDFISLMIYSHCVWESIIRAKDYLLNAPSPEQVIAHIRLLEGFTISYPRFRQNFARRPELILAQIEAARREGFRHISFYFGGWLIDEQIEALREGPFRNKSAPIIKRYSEAVENESRRGECSRKRARL